MVTKSKPRQQTRHELVRNIKADIQVLKIRAEDRSLTQAEREAAQEELDRIRHCSTKKIEARHNGQAQTQEGSQA